MAAARHDASSSSLSPERRKPCRRPNPFIIISRHAQRAGERRGRKAAAASGPRHPGIRFAPELIAPHGDHAAHFVFSESFLSEKPSTTAMPVSAANRVD